MIRKTCFALIPLQFGLLLAYLFNDTAVALMFFILAAAAITAMLLKGKRGYIVLTALSFSTGVIISCAYTANVYKKAIAFDGEDVLIEGYVYDLKSYSQSSYRVYIKGRINGGVKTLVDIYTDKDTYTSLTYGDEVKAEMKVRRISDKLGFGNESFNKANSVFLRGSDFKSVTLTGKNYHPVFKFAKRLRDKASATLTEYGGDGGKYLSAMLCGERGIVEKSDQETFYRIGVGHIFAFSGTHVAIIIGIFSAVLSIFTGRRKVHAVSYTLLGVLLILFSGLSVSAVRAVVMMCTLELSKLSKRPNDPLTSLSIASAVISCISPYCIASYSYILTMAGSFACSVYAGYLSDRISELRDRPVNSQERTVITVFSASVVLFAISAFMFGEVSIITPITNLLIVPIYTFSMSVAIAGLVLSPVSTLLSGYVIWLAGLCMRGCALLSGLVSKIPFSNVNVWHIEVKAVIIMLIAIPVTVPFIVRRKRTLISLYCLAAAGIAAASAITSYIYRDKIYLTAFSYGGANVLIADSKTSAIAFTGGGGSADILDTLALDRGADGAEYALCSEKSAKRFKQELYEHPCISANTRFYDKELDCTLGEVRLDNDRIIYKYNNFCVVISGEMVYNRLSEQGYDITKTPVEIELDRKTGEFVVRGLDYGFDHSG